MAADRTSPATSQASERRLYVPPPYRPGAEAAYEIARRHAFGTIVSAGPDGAPRATWIPFLVEGDATTPRIYGHMARGNPHWRSWDETTPLLAVFQGPHHYVSPSWYVTEPNVPTWNFVLAQVRGRPRLLHPDRDLEEIVAMLHRLVAQFEGRDPGWALASQPAAYVGGMARGIAAFELHVDGLEAMTKLSQAKEEPDRLAAIDALERLGRDDAAAIASLMRGEGGG